jgi:hypothetical protein
MSALIFLILCKVFDAPWAVWCIAWFWAGVIAAQPARD